MDPHPPPHRHDDSAKQSIFHQRKLTWEFAEYSVGIQSYSYPYPLVFDVVLFCENLSHEALDWHASWKQALQRQQQQQQQKEKKKNKRENPETTKNF